MVGCMGGCIVKDGWLGITCDRWADYAQLPPNHLSPPTTPSSPTPQKYYANQQTRQSLHIFPPPPPPPPFF